MAGSNFKKELGKVVDWSKVDKDDYLLAMERSPIKDIEIKVILQNALTDQIDDREMFMKGVDHSYEYEGYHSYRTEDLIKNTRNKSKKTVSKNVIEKQEEEEQDEEIETIKKLSVLAATALTVSLVMPTVQMIPAEETEVLDQYMIIELEPYC